MTEEASAFIVSARAGIGLVRSAGFQTCRIADFQVGMAWNSTAGLMLTAIRRFGNPRYSRFGNLRYAYCTWKSRGPPDINAPHFLLFTFMLWLHCSVVTLMEQMSQLARQAKAAGRELARLTTAQKNSCLLAMAD